MNRRKNFFHCTAYFTEWLIDDIENDANCYCINPKIRTENQKLTSKLSELCEFFFFSLVTNFVVYNFFVLA